MKAYFFLEIVSFTNFFFFTFLFVARLFWVVVTHVVNPADFYVRYVSEQRAGAQLSRKINSFCMGSNCMFLPEHIIRNGKCVATYVLKQGCRAGLQIQRNKFQPERRLKKMQTSAKAKCPTSQC